MNVRPPGLSDVSFEVLVGLLAAEKLKLRCVVLCTDGNVTA